MARREPRRSPRFRCLLLDLLEDDLLRLVLSHFEVRFDGGENGLQSEEAECCRQLSRTCRRISVALCFSSSSRSLTEIPRSLLAVDDVLSSSMVLLEEAAKLQAALRALPPEVYHEPAENTRAALQATLGKRGAMLTSARSRHAEDTKWLRKFEAQWGRQDRSEAPVLPRAMCALPRTGTRATRRQQAEEIVAREGSRRWAGRQAVGGFAFVRRVHLLTANYVRNGHIAALLHDLMQREMQEARGIKLAHLALAGHAVWLGHDVQVEGCRVLVEGFQVTQGGGSGNGDHVHINVA